MARARKKAPKKKAPAKKKAPPKKPAPKKRRPSGPPPRRRRLKPGAAAGLAKPPKYKRKTKLVVAKSAAILQKAIEEAEIACVWQGVHVECVYKPTKVGKAPWFTLTYMERS